MSPPPATPPPEGARVPEALARVLAERYELIERVGAGGSATVWVARDRKHGREVAVKVLHQPLAGGQGADRFRREIAIAARLNHPHIVPLHDSGVAAGTPFYVMPLVDGPTLSARLAEGGSLDVSEALQVARDVAEALDYAHSKGVVHRDIKPSNILLTSGHALVADFGVAHALEAAALDGLTVTEGSSVGTPAYMSPEQATGDGPIDARTDIYSLACVVFEMLTGARPFTARSPVGMMARHLHEPAPELPVVGGVTRRMADAVARALSKEPGRRFASAGAFVSALEAAGAVELAPRRGGTWAATDPGRGGVRGRRLVGRVLAVATAVGGVALAAALLRGTSEGWTGRPQSIVVLPFATPTSTEAERERASEVAIEIGQELDGWDSIYAVSRIALAGPMFDLGLEGPTFMRVDDGLAVARALGVQALLAVLVVETDSAASIEASLFDVESGRELDRPLTAVGPQDPEEARGRIVRAVLDLEDLDITAAARARSSNPEALRSFARGDRALERWMLVEARAAFEDAVARDSTFAMARLRLAQTLFWEASGSSAALRRVGDDIARLSTEALRASAGSSPEDSLHIRAFHDFQRGGYDDARAAYRRALAADPTDVYALLMLGSTEYWDPWLEETDAGLRPRADLAGAVAAFEEALRLQPTFELGYGHLFDIHQWITRAAYTGGCRGFERPRGEVLAPWDAQAPDRQLSFCPEVSDSIHWHSSGEFRALDPEQLRAGADRLFDQSLRMLRRWVAFAPDQPKPLEELAEALIERRLTMGVAPPEQLADLAREARTATERRLGMVADTSPGDVALLANLHLASGEPGRAVSVLERYAATDSAPLPIAAANTWLAVGRVERVLDMLPRDGFQLYVENPDGEGLVAFGGAEEWIDRIGVLAGLVDSETLRGELDALRRFWSGPEYTPLQRATLRNVVTPRIMGALAADSVVRSEWAAETDVELPLWTALTSADTAMVAEATSVVIEEALADRGAVLGATAAIGAGHALVRLGRPAEAARWFARVDSVAFSVRYFQPSWTLRTLAALWRGRALAAAGSEAEARAAYGRLVEAWADADGTARPVVEAARDSLARLGGGS